MDDFALLGFGDFTSLITKVEINAWGANIVIHCVYDPDERLPYQLIFNNCQKIEWAITVPINSGDLETDIIDFQLGKESHTALFCTDVFELTILYGNFELNKDW
jgi:hypothetical protein